MRSEDSTAATTRPTGRARPSGRRYAIAAVFGLGAAAVVLVVQVLGVLEGRARLLAVGLLVLALPTSRELARRVLIAGCVFLGWIPLLWWWHLPLGDVGRLGTVLALLVGGLTAWLLLGDGPAARVRLLVPRIRWADAVGVAGVAVATWVYLPLLRVSSGEVALSGFLRGWDNSAHFDMTEMIRRHGVLIPSIRQGSSGLWSYYDYPQGFHAAAATVMEGLAGPTAGDPGAELVHYTHALALVIILALTTVVAGLCALPSLRRRPMLALPLVMLVVATFTLGPGGMVLHNGFPNFYVACALLACLPLIVIPMEKVGSPVLLAALGGATLGVAHNWALLLTMGAFGAVVVLFPWRHNRWPNTNRGWLIAGAIGVPVVVGIVAADRMLEGQRGFTDLIVTAGAVTPIPVNAALLSVTAAIACAVAVGARRRGATPGSDNALRTMLTASLPAVGLVVTALIAYLQIRRVGEPGYYMWKYAIALQLLSVVIIAAAVPALVPRFVRKNLMARGVGVLASCALAAGALQAYGFPLVLPNALGGPLSPGGAARADRVAIAGAPTADAAMLLQAARANLKRSDVPYVLLPFPSEPLFPAGGGIPPMMLSQWFNSLTGGWTERANDLLRHLSTPPDESQESAVSLAREVFSKDPDAIVVVGPTYVDAVRAGVADAGWADRVASW